MDQGWRRLPLLGLFLLVLKNATGFTYGTSPNANLWWGQPSDNTFTPYAVQSSMPEAPMTGILPEEVGSNLLSKRLREKRSFDLQEFIERAVSSSSEFTSNAQTAPSRPVSTPVSLPLAELYLASVSSLLGSSGSSTTDNVDELEASPSHGSSEPEFLPRSQQLLSTQGSSGGYSGVSQSSQYNPESFMKNKLGTLPLVASSHPISAQSLPTLSMSNTQSRSDTQSVTGPFRSSLGGSYASGLLPQSQTASCQSALGYPRPFSSSSVHAPSATSFYPSASQSLPQGVASQSSALQNLRKQFTFTGGSGTHMGSSGPLPFQGSTSYGGSPQPQDITSRFAPGSPTYSSSSLPQDVGSQSATVGSTSKLLSSVYGTKTGSSAPFNLLGSTTYSTPLQAQGTSSQLALGYPPSSSKSMFSPQAIASQSPTIHDIRTQFAFTGSSGTSPGTSAPLAYHGSPGFSQLPKSQDAYRSSSPYASVSLPQDVTNQFTTGQSTRKGFTSDYGTQAGSSTPFNLLGSTTSSGPLQAQGTSSQLTLGYPPSSSKSMFSPQAIPSQSSTVHDLRKQYTFTDSSGISPGSSAPLAFQGSTGFGQLPKTQDAYRASSPYASVSLPQDGTSQFTTGQSRRKGFTSDYGTQAGSSTPFTLLGSTTYSGPLQAQGTSSQLALGYPPSSSKSMFSPQDIATQSSIHDLRKQFAFTGSSDTSPGSSAPLAFLGNTGFGQLPKTQDAYRSSSPYASVSLPQDVTSQFTSGQSTRKGFTSDYGTQAGSSTPFNLLGPLQPQGTSTQLALGYPPSSSASLSSPQGVASQLSAVRGSRKQFDFSGNSKTQTGSSARIILKGSTDYGGSPQRQNIASPLDTGSLSYPNAHPQAFVSKPFSSDYGTQTGSSALLNQLGGNIYGGSLRPQDTASPFAPGSLHPSASLPQGFPSSSTTAQGSSTQFTSVHGTKAGSSAPFTLPISTTYNPTPLQAQVTKSQLALGYPSSSRAFSSPQGVASQSSTVQGSRKQFAFTGSSSTPTGSFASLALQGPTGYGQSPKPQDAFRSSPYASVAFPQDVIGQSTAIQSSRKQFTSGYGTQAGSSTPFTLQKSTGYGGSPKLQDTASPLAPGSLSYQSVLLPQGFVSKPLTSGYGTQMGSSALLPLQGSTTYSESPKPQDTASNLIPGSPCYASASLPQGFPSKSTTAQTSRNEFTSDYGTQAGSSVALTLQRGTASDGSFQTQDTTNQFAPGAFSYSNALLPQGVGSQSTTVQGSRKQFTSSYGTQTGSTAPFTLQGNTSSGGSPHPQDAKRLFPPCASASFPQGVASQSTTLQDSRQQFTLTGGSGSHAGTSVLFNSHGSTNYGSPQAQVTTSQLAPGSPSSYPSASLSLPQSVASHWNQNIQTLGVASPQDRSMGGFSSSVSGQSASAPISSIGYGSSSLQSPGHFTKCSTGFPPHANPGFSSVSSQCTSDQSLTGLSRQERPGAQLDPSSLYMSVQGGASSTDGSTLQRVTSQFAPGLSARDAKVPASQYSKAVPSGSSPFMTQLFQNWQPSSSR